MKKTDLIKMIEDEVAMVLREPMREPTEQKSVVKPIIQKPSLQNEEEVDDYFFRLGKKKDEI